jgi:hypothetical protein
MEKFEIDERLVRGPAYFSPENPEKFIKFFYKQLIVLFRFPKAIELLTPRYVEGYNIN